MTREEMIRRQLMARDIVDEKVIQAMTKVPREDFIPVTNRDYAYSDGPAPIGEGQTISQPYIVGLMVQTLQLNDSCRVLEIGTGTGYHASIMGQIAKEVFSIEIVESLAKQAKANIEKLKYTNIHIRCSDGYDGWSEEAPFDAISLAAAPSKIPEPLVEQLKLGGKLIAPIGTMAQNLILLEKDASGKMHTINLLPVRFVPMTGEAQRK
ncbi:MAG: protein-L-isoaspartate(D-aspartate) O-methyltransferase [Bacteriovoracia bacterium]